MECSINNPALSLLMKHLVIGQRRKAPNFSAFHWSPHGSLVSIGQYFVTTRVVHLPKKTETNLITKSDQSGPNHQLSHYVRPAQPGPIRTRLCGPCIAAVAGLRFLDIIIRHAKTILIRQKDDDKNIFMWNVQKLFFRL